MFNSSLSFIFLCFQRVYKKRTADLIAVNYPTKLLVIKRTEGSATTTPALFFIILLLQALYSPAGTRDLAF